MIRALMLSFQSLSDRRVVMLLIKVVILTLLIFGVFGVGLWYALDALLAYFGWRDDGGLSALASLALLLLSGVILFRAIAVAVTWVFADDIIDAVEARHYPYHAHGSISKLPRFMLGLLGTAAMLIPFVNLLVPVIATAMAVHLVHGNGKGAMA